MTITYFLGSECLGESSLVSKSPIPLDSVAYFCATCGEIWARAVAGPVWQVEHTPCHAHSATGVANWNKVPGSLICNRVTKANIPVFLHATAIESLPPDALRREFFLHLNYYEKELVS